MMRWVRNKPTGDTLIEVIFAFAILATIIGFAYSGAVQAHKNAVSAEERTQALEVVRYQKEALTAYRNNLPWDDEGVGSTPNFTGGGQGNNAVSFDGSFCMLAEGSNSSGESVTQWSMRSVAGESDSCDSLVNSLTPLAGDSQKIKIAFAGTSPAGCATPAVCNTISAEVSVVWLDPFGREQSVRNSVLLTRQK